jgi:NAD(P)-dependent dehydrogenase (short-subunit alcohol dehydrogenase family)
MSTLTGKIVVVTGASGGLGRPVTEAFLAAGARVVGVARSIKKGDFANPEFVAMPAELASGEAANRLASAVIAHSGRIDALVHVVGGFAGGQSVAETDDATLEQMLDLNFRAAFYMIRAVLPKMREQGAGRILVVASRQGVEPAPRVGAYSASKAALVSLVRTVAMENKDRWISANTVLPGTMDTPANRAGDPGADRSRWVQPSQVAALLVHLASDAGAQITGAAIPIYGAGL